jgi:hypothetical protein
MQVIRYIVFAAVVIVLCGPTAEAQWVGARSPVSLSGPRVGATLLSPGIVDTLGDNGLHIGPVVSQFGWQFEKRFMTAPSGLTAVSETVILAGGFEQGAVLPSLSWLVGVRMPSGMEFAVGPNLTPAGPALAFAAGVTYSTGGLNVPINVAVVPSRSGFRVSVLTGFNMRN